MIVEGDGYEHSENVSGNEFFNFVFAYDAYDKKKALKLFEEIKEGQYEPYTSIYVLNELEKSPEPKRGKILSLLREYKITTLFVDLEAERLANVYINEGLIPVKHIIDGQHIAITAVRNLDFIVSFNFKHIVKRKTIEMTGLINFREGYKKVGIYSPTEVIENE
jgi:hypothetical protein